MFSNFLMSCPIFFCVLISVVSLKPEPTQGSHHYLPAALRMSFSAYLEAQIQTALECVNTFLGLPWETTKMYVEKLCLFFLSRMKRSWDTFVNFINKQTRHEWSVTSGEIAEQIRSSKMQRMEGVSHKTVSLHFKISFILWKLSATFCCQTQHIQHPKM